jgi:hypothetical protein
MIEPSQSCLEVRISRSAYAWTRLSYETDLPFDPSLFEPPPGLKITESK